MSDIGRYRRIRPRWWLEPQVAALSEGERLVALYCLSGPATNSLGLYRLSPAGAAEDLGIDADVFRGRFDTVCRALAWRFDATTRVIWIPVWLEENAPQSPNVVKNWRAAFNEIPDCAVKTQAAAAIIAFLEAKHKAFSDAFGEVKAVAIPEAFRDSKAIQEQEQEHEQDQQREQLQLASALSAPAVVAADPFDAFWSAYPKKVGKDDALRAWKRRRPDAQLAAVIIAAVEDQSTWPDWQKEGRKYVPNPTTWLNRGGWKDQQAEAVVSTVSDRTRHNAANGVEAMRLIQENEYARQR